MSFIQDWGVIDNETLVFVGATKDEIIGKCRKFKNAKSVVEKALEMDFRDNGFVTFDENRSLMWINPERKSEWQVMMTVIHECHHLAFVGVHERRAEGEREFNAYVHCWLFEQVWKKMVGTIPVPKRDRL